jgi:hypothetical protein
MARGIDAAMQAGNFGHVHFTMMNAGPVGLFFHKEHPHGNHALVLNRDGRDQVINGYVVEEVLHAPHGLGAPIVRRSLLGWSDDFAYGVSAFVEGRDALLGTYAPQEPQLHLRAQLAVMHNGPGGWTAQRGRIEISDPVIEKACPTAPGRTSYGDTATTVSCEFGRYDVRVEGEFSLERDTSTMLAMRPRTLRVSPQQLPGARFVTRCAEWKTHEQLERLYSPCMDRYAFWRDNNLFARQLNVDVAQMIRESDGMYYRRIKGPRQRRDVTVAWTLRFPDGRVIEQGSVSAATPFPLDGKAAYYAHLANSSPGDRHIQILVPHESSGYAIAVLDLELGNEN